MEYSNNTWGIACCAMVRLKVCTICFSRARPLGLSSVRCCKTADRCGCGLMIRNLASSAGVLLMFQKAKGKE
ncbi:hypothetical protein PIB30_032209 [Stylosanthes scabra]|uniref:Uncharacterized protein n=1 Tax=Stylosanthes scabra TaxID=79078 RepID=A0ABU6SC87_9FABA|nr:hypothetical protein [Stylosanthes scabra]